jgi:hypothetical protein
MFVLGALGVSLMFAGCKQEREDGPEAFVEKTVAEMEAESRTALQGAERLAEKAERGVEEIAGEISTETREAHRVFVAKSTAAVADAKARLDALGETLDENASEARRDIEEGMKEVSNDLERLAESAESEWAQLKAEVERKLAELDRKLDDAEKR